MINDIKYVKQVYNMLYILTEGKKKCYMDILCWSEKLLDIVAEDIGLERRCTILIKVINMYNYNVGLIQKDII